MEPSIVGRNALIGYVVVLGLGYVLGSKAGRRRYEQIAEVKSKLQRMSPIEQGDEYHALFGDLVAMEAYRRSLLEQASGDDLTG